MDIIANSLNHVDHFNLRLNQLAMENHDREAPILATATRKPPQLIKSIVCSQCGISFKRSIDFDQVDSSSGISHFCREECAKTFRRTELKLLTPTLLSIIDVQLRQGKRVNEIALDLKVSSTAVARIKHDMNLDAVQPSKEKNWLL